MAAHKKRPYSVTELGDIAAGLRRILAEIESGIVHADEETTSHLEAAADALGALADGAPLIGRFLR